MKENPGRRAAPLGAARLLGGAAVAVPLPAGESPAYVTTGDPIPWVGPPDPARHT
jgi:hypothetical protein